MMMSSQSFICGLLNMFQKKAPIWSKKLLKQRSPFPDYYKHYTIESTAYKAGHRYFINFTFQGACEYTHMGYIMRLNG